MLVETVLASRSPVPPPSTVGPVDLGQVIGQLARANWSSIEARAGLVIEIDAAGPVVADEAALAAVLDEVLGLLLSGVSPGHPQEHVVGLRSRRGLAADEVRVELRHVAFSEAPGGLVRAAPPDAAQLGRVGARLAAFGARLEMEPTGPLQQVFRVLLRTSR